MNYVEHVINPIFSADQIQDVAQPISVSQLVGRLKRDVEDKHRQVAVVGEISSFKVWRSGHCYFDLKDENALLPGVMFKPHFSRLNFAVVDGMQVLCRGRVSIYSANSRLQMIVESMEPLGHGALALAFEQLKERLKNEGLFDAQHKKPIKYFNQCIGIITSSHGAVLRDMVKILRSRMPKADIVFFSVRVQGAGAALEIKKAIEFVDAMSLCDVIIVGRGGGSLEDLWAFNEEIVARAIFNANTPIISAVGHETDTTISDYVADVRAATPTHAATLAVPNLTDIIAELNHARARLLLKHQVNMRSFLLALSHMKRTLREPRVALFRHWQLLDERYRQLTQCHARRIKAQRDMLDTTYRRLLNQAPLRQLRLKRESLLSARTALSKKSPLEKIYQAKLTLRDQKKILTNRISLHVYQLRQKHLQMTTKLDALSPLRVLSRGFSLVEDADGKNILSKTEHFHVKDIIRIKLCDGVIRAQVINDECL